MTTRTKWTQERFDKLATDTRIAQSAMGSFRVLMDARYGSCSPMYWSTPHVKKYNQLRNKYDKLYGKLMDAIREVSPRQWESGIPVFWIVENVTYAMAVTRGEISPVPPASWGSVQNNTQWASPLA